jgi:predicted dehydrogenase
MGVCGAGNFARKVLLPALSGTGRVQWESIATATGVTARHVGEAKGFRRAVGSAADVMADPEVDAVLIATRHDTHAALVLGAVEAGKRVYVEKPLAVTPLELQALEGLEGLNHVTVGFNRRTAPATVAIADRLRTRHGPLVADVRINAGRLPKDHWADTPEQGGRIVGEVGHFVDLICVLAMSSVRRVTASGSGLRSPEVEDTLQVLLDLYDGSSSTLSYLANGGNSLSKERVELHWDGRSAVIDDFRTWRFYDGERLVRGGSRRQDKGHAGLVSAFVNTAIDGGLNPVPAAQAVHVTRVTFAIVESLRTGGSVILGREGW